MARTANSSKSESVTIRIPNDLFAQIKAHAFSNTRGNTSLTIIELLEAALSAVNTQPSMTMQDNTLQPQLSETRQAVQALDEQVNQLSELMQGTLLQRITQLESQFEVVLGESCA